jgi:hypothetical protein
MADLLLRVMRYLTFETSRACTMTRDHPKCPIGHPERYRFGLKDKPLTDDQVFEFWRWAHRREFRGIILWHWYNEPTLSMPRIRRLMERIKAVDPYQPFQLFSNDPAAPFAEFDLIKLTDYSLNKDLDDRIASAWGEGQRHPHQPTGYCGRGWGWEMPIDVYGNWCLCCNDWRCEESVGNIKTDDWDELLRRFYAKSSQIKWKDQASWDALPRMCRACMDVNFSLHRTGGSFPTP